jgi:hypothetical protein
MNTLDALLLQISSEEKSVWEVVEELLEDGSIPLPQDQKRGKRVVTARFATAHKGKVQ